MPTFFVGGVHAARELHHASGLSLCSCFGDDSHSRLIGEVKQVASNSKYAANQFAHAAALSTDPSLRFKIQAAEQQSIAAYSEAKAAVAELKSDSVHKQVIS